MCRNPLPESPGPTQFSCLCSILQGNTTRGLKSLEFSMTEERFTKQVIYLTMTGLGPWDGTGGLK